jgi:hypothetical protein
MILSKAMEKIRKLSRTKESGASNLVVMDRINDAQKEFFKSVGSVTKEDYVTVVPSFDLQVFYAIHIEVVGGTNSVDSDVSICVADALDQTGTQVAAALQTAIRTAIGPAATLTVAWSTTSWKFTIDAIDSTSITLAEPSGITYYDALSFLGLSAETTTGTSVTGDLPTDCTVESALPADFLLLQAAPEWNGYAL